MKFCENLVRLRTEHNIPQANLAKAAGVSLPTYQRYEYGTREPQLSTLIALADFYNITLDDLVCRERRA